MPANYLIYSLKQDNRSDVLDFLSAELSGAIKNSLDLSSGDYVVTNVPRRKRAIVDFGYDHARELARRVADILGLEYVEILESKSKKAQKTVFGDERRRNAIFDYICDDDFTLKGKCVILIDDIVTTGSSITNCATLIKALRPKSIVAASLGVAYKEPRIDFTRY
jgi:predicted amidophosphoribosyltransferase